jgi:hypothetical protein
LTTNSLFEEPWWLDALAPGAWDAVEVEHNGQVVARLPYVRRNRYGITALVQPPLTQALGPWLAESEGKYARRLELEKNRMNDLIERLPDFHVFQQNFAPQITNWLPFYWAGFTATVRYTYRFDDLDDLDAIWRGFTDSTRNAIRKSQKQVEVRDDMPFDDFVGLYAASFARQGMAPAVSEDVLRRLDAAAHARGARRLLFAVDAEGRARAGVYVVYDERTAYYLLSGRHPDFQHGGGDGSLLIWEAIQAARETSKVFDFEGSMVEPIERFFRSFGCRQVPYLSVQKLRGPAKVAAALRSLR